MPVPAFLQLTPGQIEFATLRVFLRRICEVALCNNGGAPLSVVPAELEGSDRNRLLLLCRAAILYSHRTMTQHAGTMSDAVRLQFRGTIEFMARWLIFLDVTAPQGGRATAEQIDAVVAETLAHAADIDIV
jgi:hypothetical protein